VEPPSTDNLLFPQIPLRDLGVLLVKHYNVHEGLWDVTFQMQVSIGQMGPEPAKALPGAMINIAAVGLSRANQVGPLTVNAAELNPAT
jgi:hypothetical protein